jgi:clan AA aspartic protease (TIGR02281 family)
MPGRLEKFERAIVATAILLSSVLIPAQAEPPLKGDVQYNKEGNIQVGVDYYKNGNYKAASECFQSISLPQSQATALYYQALCSQQMGNGTAALKLYRRVATTYPNSQEARLAALYLEKFRTSAGAAGSNSRNSANTVTGSVPGSSIFSSRDRLPDSCGVSFHRAPGNHMLVNATVGGRQMEVMFDTGAASCYFGRNQLEAAGAKFTPTGQKTQSMGVGGYVDVEICLAEVRLGDIVRTIPLMVASKAEMTPLLGQNFFNPFRYDIDTSAGMVHFYKKGGSSHESFDTMNVPFVQTGNELQVVASINGHETQAFFDTGAGCTMFSMSAARNMGLSIPHDATPIMVNGVGGGSLAYRFRVDRVALGPVQKSNMEIVVSPSCPVSLIGQDFFKDKRFTIDNEAHMIKFVH